MSSIKDLSQQALLVLKKKYLQENHYTMKNLIRLLSTLTFIREQLQSEEMDERGLIIWEHFRIIWKGKVGSQEPYDTLKTQALFF